MKKLRLSEDIVVESKRGIQVIPKGTHIVESNIDDPNVPQCLAFEVIKTDTEMVPDVYGFESSPQTYWEPAGYDEVDVETEADVYIVKIVVKAVDFPEDSQSLLGLIEVAMETWDDLPNSDDKTTMEAGELTDEFEEVSCEGDVCTSKSNREFTFMKKNVEDYGDHKIGTFIMKLRSAPAEYEPPEPDYDYDSRKDYSSNYDY
jgi:hypothetical protein